MLHPDDPYLQRTIQELAAYEEDLWYHLEHVSQLPSAIGLTILSGFLEQACQSQHVSNILIGRAGIQRLPRAWVLQHIEQQAEPLLQLDDDWEYLRLIEVYWSLDKALVQNLAHRALQSTNHAVREVGQDCLKKLADPVAKLAVNYWET